MAGRRDAEREKRLAAALRANLGRRKQQARALRDDARPGLESSGAQCAGAEAPPSPWDHEAVLDDGTAEPESGQP